MTFCSPVLIPIIKISRKERYKANYIGKKTCWEKKICSWSLPLGSSSESAINWQYDCWSQANHLTIKFKIWYFQVPSSSEGVWIPGWSISDYRTVVYKLFNYKSESLPWFQFEAGEYISLSIGPTE
jgi:hypothetical protein